MSLLRTARLIPGLTRRCVQSSTVMVNQRRGNADMAFSFACPANVFYNEANIKQVDVPSFSGNFGILPNHVPILAVMQPGVVVVHEDDGSQKKYFVSSGSISVNEDSSVQILAEEAAALDDLDPQAVRDGLSKAQQELASASSDTAKAEAQIAVDCYEAMQKAVQ